MTAKSVLVRPQGLRPRARALTCPLLLRHCRQLNTMVGVKVCLNRTRSRRNGLNKTN